MQKKMYKKKYMMLFQNLAAPKRTVLCNNAFGHRQMSAKVCALARCIGVPMRNNGTNACLQMDCLFLCIVETRTILCITMNLALGRRLRGSEEMRLSLRLSFPSPNLHAVKVTQDWILQQSNLIIITINYYVPQTVSCVNKVNDIQQ